MSEGRITRTAGSLRVGGDDVWREDAPPPLAGAPLQSRLVALGPEATLEVEAGADDVLLYVVDGLAAFRGEALAAGSAVRLGRGERGAVAGRGSRVHLIEFRCGPACDEHAPLGTPARIAHVDLTSLDAATSGREFQVLFDMHNGSPRGTLFLGKVPPGAAPWHFHQYDEIVWILEGHGLYHLAEGPEEFEAGSAFRVRPREVHVVENATSRPMLLLGLFTPAGSPAAAFLATKPRPAP